MRSAETSASSVEPCGRGRRIVASIPDASRKFKRKGAKSQRRKAGVEGGEIGFLGEALATCGSLQLSSLGRIGSADKVRISSLKGPREFGCYRIISLKFTQVVDFPHPGKERFKVSGSKFKVLTQKGDVKP